MKYKRYIRLVVILIIIGGLVKGITSILNEYNNKSNSLFGKWVSQETGKVVEFIPDGTVVVDQVERASCTIDSLSQMLYHIEGHTFEMGYEVNGRSLVWGLIGQEENFDRKGF